MVAGNATCEAGTPDSASHVASMLEDGSLALLIVSNAAMNPSCAWPRMQALHPITALPRQPRHSAGHANTQGNAGCVVFRTMQPSHAGRPAGAW